MSAPSKLSATLLSILTCLALLAGAGLAAAAPSRSPGTPALARAACAKGASRAGRRKASAGRRCRSHQSQTRPEKLPRPHPTRAPRSRPATPETPPAPPAPASSAPTTQVGATAHAATIATILATPCQNTELTPEVGNIPLVRAAVLCLIDRKRAENGENPLKPSAQLEQAAEGHSQELVADDYFAHVSPSGETPVERIRATGYIPNPSVGYVIGENLAWGTYQLATPQAIVAAWIASPGHLANILEAQYTETGIGVTPAVPASLAPGSPGATYAQEFGVIIP